MKDSGVEWLGQIPDHWQTERAKWIFRKIERPVREGDEVVTCFRDGVVTLRKNRRLRGFTESLTEFGYQGVRRGDLVIHAMDAFAGAIGVADSDGKGTSVYSVCSPRLERVNTYYYAFCVREMARSQWILALSKGIRERSTDFRYSVFASQIVPLPPHYEQDGIVRVLDHADRRIRNYVRAKQKLIALLEEQKQAIIHRAVTGQIDIRTGQPYPAYKASGVEWLGDVPEHWEVRRLKSLSVVKRGASPRPIGDSRYFDDNGEYAWVRISDVTASNNYLEVTTQRLSRLGQSLSVELQPGALFLSIAGSVGKPIITKVKCCIHDGFVYFPQFSGSAEFLCRVLSCEAPFAKLGKLGTQLNLNTDTVGCIYIGWPPESEQEEIVDSLVDAIEGIDSVIVSVKRQIALLREHVARLIADVVTGKLDVRREAAALPTVDSFDAKDDPDGLLDEDLDVDSRELVNSLEETKT